MKKLTLILLCCILFCGCNVTYNVTTESDFQLVKQNMLNIVNDYGYELDNNYIYDTITYNGYPNHYTFETYQFINENDSLKINLQYRHRAITEMVTIPYIDNCKIICGDNNLICDTIQKIIVNLPKSQITTLTEETATGIIIFIALLPLITMIGYTSIFSR